MGLNAADAVKGIYLVLDSYEAIRRQKSKLQQNLRSGWPKIDYFLQLC
jgi:hypothetical protein